MDTTKLVVGQEVFVVSGCCYSNGKVIKVTPEGVEVQRLKSPLAQEAAAADASADASASIYARRVSAFSCLKVARDKVIWQFDTKGEMSDGVAMLGWEAGAPDGNYKIDDMPFEERKAELVEAELRRELLHKKYPDGSVLPANEPLPPIFDGPFWY